MDNAAVGANGNVNTGLGKIRIPGGSYFNQRRSLSAADAFGLPGDADGAAADADLDKVRSGFGQEQKTVPVYHIACADLDPVAVLARCV